MKIKTVFKGKNSRNWFMESIGLTECKSRIKFVGGLTGEIEEGLLILFDGNIRVAELRASWETREMFLSLYGRLS